MKDHFELISSRDMRLCQLEIENRGITFVVLHQKA